MRIAISNLAWDVVEDEQVASLLKRYGVDAIDIAPGKYFPAPKLANTADIERVRDWWANWQIDIIGMQALLFGTTGLNMFGPSDTQSAMLDHLDSVCRIGSGLGARRLVFGSPKNRDRAMLSDQEVSDTAVVFFRRLGDIASHHGVFICLEPTPPCYGANFMTDSAETAHIVSEVAHPAIRLQLDTGALTINGEEPGQVIPQYASLIGHVHASEPNLITVGEGGTDHAAVASQLYKLLPHQIVSIEMLSTKVNSSLAAIERALRIAIQHYRGRAGQEAAQ